MLKSDMTCEKCIYHAEIGDDVFSRNNVVCRRTEATKTKGRETWCGQGNWQAIDRESGQWVVWSWGDWDPSEEEKKG